MRIGQCEWCKEDFRTSRPEQRFCSRSHSKMGRLGAKNNSWKGGRRIHKQSGRVTVLRDGKHVLEHREIMRAPAGLVVHHKDEDPTNNDPSNLQLMSRSEHTALHNRLNPRHGHNRDELGRFSWK